MKKLIYTLGIIAAAAFTFASCQKEKSIDQSGAKFTWGVSDGEKIADLVPTFKHVEDRSLVEGMEVMYPIYKLIGKIKPIRNLSNKIAVLRKS